MKNNVFILESYEIGDKKYRLIHDKNQALPYSIEKYIDGMGAKFWQQIGSWYSKKGNAIRFSLPKQNS